MPSPKSFLPALDEGWRISADLIQQIHDDLCSNPPDVRTKLQRHNALQDRIVALGQRLGFEACAEPYTDHLIHAARGRFDAAWTPRTCGGKRIVFEIDSSWRHRSLRKLALAAESDLRLWIYYGSRSLPGETDTPGLRKVNILQMAREDVGMQPRRRPDKPMAPGDWPTTLTFSKPDRERGRKGPPCPA